MSNVGSKLLAAGFLEEAQERASRAIRIPNYHANINDLLRRLREVPDEESKKEAEILEKVKDKAAFYRLVGGAALRESPKTIAEKWKSKECILTASVDGALVRFLGSYEEGEMALARLAGVGMLSGPFAASPKKTVRHVEYTLRMRGELLVGEVKRTTDGAQTLAFMDLGLSTTKVVMSFQAQRTELTVMDGSRFYTLSALSVGDGE